MFERCYGCLIVITLRYGT